jgi:hypothetical protein
MELMNGQRNGKLKVNQNKMSQISFPLSNQACPAAQMVNVAALPQKEKKRNEISGHAS